MSDPLGVAGSAVGIVSLGLQVSQGLINYLSAVKGRKEEIEDGIQEVQRVVSLLYSLNHVLPEVGARRCTQSLQGNLDSCYTKLEKLQKFLDGLQSSPPSAGPSGTVRDATRSLIYPFQQGKLNTLHHSLRNDLGNLKLAIEIVTLELNRAIRQEVQQISQDAITNSTHQSGQLRSLRMQVQHNSDQLDSLKSTISASLEVIRDQLHHTQWIIQDHEQRVDGRLTWIETGLSSIAHDSAVTTANIARITQMLSSESQSLSNMGMQFSRVQKDSDTYAIGEDHSMSPAAPGSLISKKLRPIISPSPTCDCASTLPTSRTSFTLWHLKFELEVQEQHHRGCRLFGIHRGKKRKVYAQFPLKVAWFSARMAFACLEYTSGISSPGYSVRCRNVVDDQHSPVFQTFHETRFWNIKSIPGPQLVRDIEAMECRIMSMYRDGMASPYDRNERGRSHAEIFFLELSRPDLYNLLDKMIEDNQVLLAVLRVLDKLLEINNDSDGIPFASILPSCISWSSLILTKTEVQNAHYLLHRIGKVAFIGSHCILFPLSGTKSRDILSTFLRAVEYPSPLHKAIILKSLESLIDCVSKSPTSILEPISAVDDLTDEMYTVLHYVSDWPQGMRYLLSTQAITLLDNNPSLFGYLPPVVLAGERGQVESVTLLMEAGCCLELSLLAGSAFRDISTECMEVIASNLAKRRIQLLSMAQEKLGKFLEGTTVAFADFAAATICDSLDKACIPFHQSLRVERDYKSIYSCTAIPCPSFCVFWENGFRPGKLHDDLGLRPAMIYRSDMFRYSYDRKALSFFNSYCWMRDNGFLDITPTDPLKLGISISSTAYHYTAALFGSSFYASSSYRPQEPVSEAWHLVSDLSKIQVEDECGCWCNATNHGCSPIKLLLKSHVDKRWYGIEMEFDMWRHIIFHHEILDSSSSPRGFAIELLRLLTFEALDMTHTCCTFEGISEDIGRDSICTASQKPAAIFSCRAEKVRRIRSCAEEVASARLLEDLMSEFTTQLTKQPPCPAGLEHFIRGYWRQRMSQLYDPDPRVIQEMEQHQAFRGLNASSGVETYALPKRVLRLLGDDFKLTGHENSEDDGSLSSWSESLSEIDQLSDNQSLSDTESVSDFKPFCQYCLMNDSSSDDESINYESGDDENSDDESSAGESVEGSSSGL